MDRFDALILQALQEDGRMRWSHLAGRINLSASACQRRVEALEEDGVIENFTVNLNEKALGHRVKAFVEVSVDRKSTDLAQEFRRKLVELPQVQACHMVSGTIDFMLEVVAPELLRDEKNDDDAFSVLTSPVEAWGLADDLDFINGDEAETAFQASLRLARARVVIGVVGLITFLLLTAPIEEVERRTKR